MTITFVDLVCVATTAGGTGAFQLGSAVDGYRGVEALQDGAAYSYSVQQGSNFEVGYGTYVALSGTLSRTVRWSSHGNTPVSFDANAAVNFTFTAEDIADLAALAGSVAATAKAAFNAYGLQWALWFNEDPGAGEMLALFSAGVDFQYPANFLGSVTAPPLVNPTDTWTSTLELQVGGTGAWTEVGQIVIGTDGTVSLVTEGFTVAKGSRIRWMAPAGMDITLKGFSVTLKGVIP